MDILTLLIVVSVGFIAGVINTVAAGGSLLTLPTLIFLGLPSAVANGTNRVALVVQSIVATMKFRSSGHFNRRLGYTLGIPAVIGSIIGANLAISISDEWFNALLAVMMVITVIFIVWKPLKTSDLAADATFTRKQTIIGGILFFFIGIYGGFIQAGAGFFIIATLTAVFGISLIQSNAIKVFVTGLFVSASLVVFIWNGQVNWLIGITLAVGNALGALVGSSIAIHKGDKWIKIFLVITVLAMSFKLLGFF